MKYSLGVDAWISFLMFDEATGKEEQTGLNLTTGWELEYADASGQVFQTAAPILREIGRGVYDAFFSGDADPMQTRGRLWTYLSHTDCVPWRNLDEITDEPSSSIGYTIRILVEDENGDPVEGAGVQVRTPAAWPGGVIVRQSTTNVDGYIDLIVTGGSYNLYVWMTGFDFPTAFPQSISVTGNESFLVPGVRFNPTNPGGPDTCAVYGWLLDGSGLPRAGVTVRAALAKDGKTLFSSSSVSKLLSGCVVETTTDAQGYWVLALVPNADVVPAGARWQVTLEDTPAGYAYVTVPANASANIEDLL